MRNVRQDVHEPLAMPSCDTSSSSAVVAGDEPRWIDRRDTDGEAAAIGEVSTGTGRFDEDAGDIKTPAFDAAATMARSRADWNAASASRSSAFMAADANDALAARLRSNLLQKYESAL